MTTELTTNSAARNQSWSRFYRIGAITAFLTVLVMVSEIVITFLPGGGASHRRMSPSSPGSTYFTTAGFSAFAISVAST